MVHRVAILVIELYQSAGCFRAIPSQIQAIEDNLSIGSMDFDELADGIDQDGIFRRFPGAAETEARS